MKRFWVRFTVVGSNDPRPITFPIPIEWWCTGYDSSDDAINCAIVDAPNEREAWKQITSAGNWPEAKQSFCDVKPNDWRPEPTRFPPKEAQ